MMDGQPVDDDRWMMMDPWMTAVFLRHVFMIVYVNVYVCMHACMYASLFVFMYAHMYVNM